MPRETLELLLERLPITKSIEDLQLWAHELRDILEVSHVVYHTVSTNGEHIGAFTYSLDWARIYVEKNYVAIDPVISGISRRFHPIDWKTLDWSSPQARAFLLESQSYGIGNQGWTVPIWGPKGEFAFFGVNHKASDEEWSKFTRTHAKDILLVSHLVHQHASRIINQEIGGAGAALSPREREALAQLSIGQSRAAVANSLHISENTLRAYIDSARHKLGAANVTHAVALATARGLIVTSAPLPKY